MKSKHPWKKILIAAMICALFVCTSLQVQAASTEPQIEWQQSYEGLKAYSVIQTQDGGYLLTGTNTSIVDMPNVVMKTDASGKIKWSRSYFFGNAYPLFAKAIQTNDTWYVLAGQRNVEGFPSTAPKANARQLCLAKIDPNGSMQWSMTYIHDDGALNNDFAGFVQTPDQGFLIAGNWYTFEPTDTWTWIAKTDISGSLQWARVVQGQYGGFSLGSVALTNESSIAMFGATNTQGSYPIGMQLIESNIEGTKQWQKIYHLKDPAIDQSGAYDGIQTRDGGFLLAGFGGRQNDSWLVKTDGGGVMQWNHTYPEFGSTKTAIQAQHGGYAFTSTKSGDTWFVQTDSNGSITWSKQLPDLGSGKESILNVIGTREGGYAVLSSQGNDLRFKTVLVKISSSSTIPEVPTVLSYFVLVSTSSIMLIVVGKRIRRKTS